MFGNDQARGNVYADSGGASRFFYCPKASRSERDAGLEEFEAAQSLYTRGTGLKANGDGSERSESRNIHPTVKPIALARYLARLILPPIPNARMLTPFSGSGSEVIGALQAGWSHVDGIDSWDVAVRISRARIAHWASRIEPVQLDLAGE
jgi:site-specific DNA-methyltransferase (adenine-specific)